MSTVKALLFNFIVPPGNFSRNMSYDHVNAFHFMGFTSQQLAKMCEIQLTVPVIPGYPYISTDFLEIALFFPRS